MNNNTKVAFRRLLGHGLLSLLLAACGGGGSDGGNGDGVGSNLFTVRLDQTQIQLSLPEGSQAQPVVIGASATGGDDNTGLWIRAEATAPGLDPRVEITIDPKSRTARVTVRPDTSRAPGRYQGTLKIFACANESCSLQHSGSPLELKFDIEIKAVLKSSRTDISMQSTVGLSWQPEHLQVQLPKGATRFDWAVRYGGGSTGPETGWLIVTETADGLRLQPAPDLRPGQYNADLALIAAGSELRVSVSAQLRTPIGWALNHGGDYDCAWRNGALDCGIYGHAPEHSLQLLSTVNYPILNWSVSTDATWLKLRGGDLNDLRVPFFLSVDAAAASRLPIGRHQGKLFISAFGIVVSEIPLNLNLVQ